MFTMSHVFKGLLVLTACAVLLPAGSSAETIVHTDNVALSTTNWNDSVTIPKFSLDPLCLQSVCIELSGHVEGTAKFESLDAAPATIDMNLQATITLQRPDTTPLVTVTPLVNSSDLVTAHDGVIDFGGDSGRTYADLSGDAIESGCTSIPADMALFSGTGNIVLPAVALGTSNGSGAGNLLLQFNTSASVGVTVTYTYDCTIAAEDATWSEIKGLYR